MWCCFVVAAAALGDDHYATLKVKRTAKAKEIRAQYRKLAKKYHPVSADAHFVRRILLFLAG